jgi:hypothetical protein
MNALNLRLPIYSVTFGLSLLGLTRHAEASSYASGINISGLNVNFVLNQPASTLEVSINGGAPFSLDGSTKGTKSFTLSGSSDTFSIRVVSNDATGYRIPTGNTFAVTPNGLSQPTNESGFNLISDDTNILGRFNSPRGVAVSNHPNAPNFGIAYISNSAAGSVAAGGAVPGAPARTLTGEGFYALKADQSDGFGYGNTAQNLGLASTASTNSPYRISAASNGEIFVADFSDAAGGIGKLNANLTTGSVVLATPGGPTTLTAGANHGSTIGVHAVINGAGVDLYTIDEDLTSLHVTGAGSNTDRNSIWKYSLTTTASPQSTMPVKLASPLLNSAGVVSDLQLGADGKIYLSQNRSAGGEAGITVLDNSGTTLFDSLSGSRTLLGNPTAADIFRNVQGIAVSPDQQWIAAILNGSDIGVIPLVNGIPDLANRLIVNTGTDINSGRDIAFDAAGNIHYVSSGQGIYRVIAPGGYSESTTTWDGTQFSFSSIPEPSAMALLFGVLALKLRRRR